MSPMEKRQKIMGHDPVVQETRLPAGSGGSKVMSGQKDIMVILSTAPPEISDSLARMLVENHTVACVNVVPVRSYYRWKGEFCDEREHLLVAKTTREKVKEVIVAMKDHHPYEVPEIVALPVSEGYLPYLEWVTEETLDAP